MVSEVSAQNVSLHHEVAIKLLHREYNSVLTRSDIFISVSLAVSSCMLQVPVGNSFLPSTRNSLTAALQGDQPFTNACGVHLVVQGNCSHLNL